MSFSKEAEIRPKQTFDELLECCAQDALELAGRCEFVPIRCPACDASESDFFCKKNLFEYRICENCETIYNSPRPTKDDLKFCFAQSRSAKYLAEEFYPKVKKMREEKHAPERVARVLSMLEESSGPSRATVVDVGGGDGYFLSKMRESRPEFRYRVIEPNPVSARESAEKGLQVQNHFLDDVTEWQADNDFITCFEVLEHVHDPLAFVSSIRRLLKPGGHALITSLSGDGFDIRMLEADSNIIAPPQHLNFMSIRGYQELFSRAGFSDTKITTPGRLDVNIVENKLQENPSIEVGKFVRQILESSDEVKNAFQRFLADNRLSSHVWVLATN